MLRRPVFLLLHYLLAFLWSLPWIIPPLVTWFRLRNSRSLDEESDVPLDNPPLVSVILPARNEAHNIARCMSSIMSTTYPNLELIVVDDSSSDGTAEIAREVATGDRRWRSLLSASPGRCRRRACRCVCRCNCCATRSGVHLGFAVRRGPHHRTASECRKPTNSDRCRRGLESRRRR